MNQEERMRRDIEIGEKYENRWSTLTAIVAIVWFFSLISPLPYEIRLIVAFVGAFLVMAY